MDVGTIYSVSLGTLFAIFIGWHLAAVCSPWWRTALTLLKKNIVHTLVVHRQNGTTDASIYAGFCVCLLIAGNAVACALHVSTIADLSQRSAVLCSVNMVPLFLSGRTSIIADQLFGLSHPFQSMLHRWLGRIFLLEAALHGLIQLALAKWTSTAFQISLISLISIILISSLLYVRRLAYELFLKLHVLLVVALNVMLWFHLSLTKSLQITAISVATGLWVLQKLTWLGRILYLNLGATSGSSVCVLDQGNGDSPAFRIEIPLHRQKAINHGQYVYITLPSYPRNLMSSVQAHPYLVAWLVDRPDGTGANIILLVQCNQNSRNHMMLRRPNPRVLIDGPFGNGPSLHNYDKVVFICSGIGIAAHLLGIRSLLQAHNKRTARVRRISLLWILESRSQEVWALEYLHELMKMDNRRIFTILICGSTTRMEPPQPQWPRLFRVGPSTDIGWVVDKEFTAEAGNMVVSVCGSPLLESVVRRATRASPHDVDLCTSPFQMDETSASRAMVTRLVGNH